MADKYAVLLMQEALKKLYGYDVTADGIWGAKTDIAYKQYVARKTTAAETTVSPAIPDGDVIHVGNMTISKKALDLIVHYETGGKAYYEKYLRRPTWPKGQSGVTVGIGFDLGYNTPEQIRDAWGKVVSPTALNKMVSVAGIKGSAAQAAANSIKNYVEIPWDAAAEVFSESTLPRFAGYAVNTFEGLENLNPDIQGVILSLVFNRGASLNGPTRTEMRNIRNHIISGDLDKIAGEIRGMKRLWRGKGLDGLLKRRDAEAALVESSLL